MDEFKIWRNALEYGNALQLLHGAMIESLVKEAFMQRQYMTVQKTFDTLFHMWEVHSQICQIYSFVCHIASVQLRSYLIQCETWYSNTCEETHRLCIFSLEQAHGNEYTLTQCSSFDHTGHPNLKEMICHICETKFLIFSMQLIPLIME